MGHIDAKELQSALRDIAYALKELNDAMTPHSGSYEVSRLLKCVHNAIDKIAVEG